MLRFARRTLHLLAVTTLLGLPNAGWAQTGTPTPRADSLRIAAEAGDPSAQHAYGSLFVLGGEGVDRSYTTALDWFGRAAAQGHLGAMLSLSNMHFTSDPTEAHRWLLQAAEAGSAEGQWRLYLVLSGGVPLSGIVTDRDAAAMWRDRAIAQGHVTATVSLADLQSQSEDPSGYARAAELYRQAADPGGSAWAALRMGMIHATGEGVPADDEAAVQWFSRLGTDFELDPLSFSNEDLEVLGGLQFYYGVDFAGGSLERDSAAAAEAFRIALEIPSVLLHPSFARAAAEMLRRIGN